ncbi:MAG: hypothetical protein IT303_19395 [Dehalococcoidia bacterium]|nr:hypothetical protein [Dehalococcoidia bacterium]
MSPRPVLESIYAPAGASWCHHPREELQPVFEAGARPLPGRYFCGSCGETLFAAPPPAAAAKG